MKKPLTLLLALLAFSLSLTAAEKGVKKMDFSKLKVFQKIARGENVRILALGSSNTEHFMVGAHWFDYVNMGFMHKYRKWSDDRSTVDNPQLCLNAGTSNNTTRDLLNRFERDVVPFKPDLVILTIGINDANPHRNITPEQTRANLIELRNKVEALGGEVLFQTYYSADLEKLRESAPGWAENYMKYSDIVREVAGPMLNDNLKRWERLRKANVKLFRLLMRDPLHVNPVGNAVIGLDLIRLLDLKLPDENLPWIRDGVFAQYTMDLLEQLEENGK